MTALHGCAANSPAGLRKQDTVLKWEHQAHITNQKNMFIKDRLFFTQFAFPSILCDVCLLLTDKAVLRVNSGERAFVLGTGYFLYAHKNVKAKQLHRN